MNTRIFAYFIRHTVPPPEEMSKRQRTNTQPTRRAKRPIDKKLINVLEANLGVVQYSQDLYPPANFPGTITGLRWEIVGMRAVGTAQTSVYRWAIVVATAGNNPNTLTSTGGASMYDPEQNVLAYGVGCSANLAQDTAQHWSGSTKSMRKLKAGDRLVFLAIGDSSTSTNRIAGSVQFFYKT